MFPRQLDGVGYRSCWHPALKQGEWLAAPYDETIAVDVSCKPTDEGYQQFINHVELPDGTPRSPDLKETRGTWMHCDAIKASVEEQPEIKAKIEERLRNVPAANRERAFINAAKTEAMNQTVRPNGVRV